MFDMFAEVYIEGSVWSDFSDLIGRDIKYYDHQNNVVNGVVQSLSVGDIWEDTMSTERGTFLDVYAEIDGKDGECVCVGMLNLFGRGWTWQGIDSVIDNDLFSFGHPVYLSEDQGVVFCGDMVIPVFADGSLDMDNVCPLSECIFDYDDCEGGE